GADVAGVAYAHAMFGAQQGDLAGVHTAERADVDREPGRRAGRLDGVDVHPATGGVDFVGSGDDLQALGPDAGIDPQGAGDEVGVVGAGGVQAGAVNHDRATVHAVAFKHAVVDDRRAGCQRQPAGVDEAATVAVDAGGAGDHHLCAVAPDLDVTAQAAGIAAGDLVEDHPGSAGRQPQVTLYPPAQPRLHPGAR